MGTFFYRIYLLGPHITRAYIIYILYIKKKCSLHLQYFLQSNHIIYYILQNQLLKKYNYYNDNKFLNVLFLAANLLIT